MPIEAAEQIWIDGGMIPWKEATVHVMSHSLHYGSGVFDGIRAYSTPRGTAAFRLTDHVRRLFASAAMLRMELPFQPSQLVDAAKTTVRVNGLASAYIRPLAFRGEGEMGLYPQRAPVRVAIAAWAWGPYLGEAVNNGARVSVSSWRRNDPNIVLPEAKGSGQYVNSILAKIDAVSAGFDEAIMLNLAGQVAEGSGENIFMVKGGDIVTPPSSAGILMGITRDTVIRLARDLGYPVKERTISRGELYIADELFFSGTGAEVTPIREVDGRIVGSGGRGPITARIQDLYFGVVQGKISGYDEWLEFV